MVASPPTLFKLITGLLLLLLIVSNTGHDQIIVMYCRECIWPFWIFLFLKMGVGGLEFDISFAHVGDRLSQLPAVLHSSRNGYRDC